MLSVFALKISSLRQFLPSHNCSFYRLVVNSIASCQFFHSSSSYLIRRHRVLMSAEAANSKDYSLPPALDLKLDKSVFERKEVVLAVGLPLGRDFKKVWDQLRDFSTGYLDLPKFTNIYTDGNGVKRKLVFIRKAKDTKEQDMLRSLNVDIPASPEDEISYLESHPEAICVENCQPGESTTDSILPSKPCAFRLSLGYENFPFDRALKVVLPGDMEAVTGFSLVGHVAHFNLKPAALPYRRLIGKTEKKLCDFICFNATGQIALDKLANVRTVVNKAAKIDTDFRTFSLDLMAGEPDYLTEVKENNVTLKLDFSQVYWNSRLGRSEFLSHVGALQAQSTPALLTRSKLCLGVTGGRVSWRRLWCTTCSPGLDRSQFRWLVAPAVASSPTTSTQWHSSFFKRMSAKTALEGTQSLRSKSPARISTDANSFMR
uniref:tRNA wybutosine-synthesizing protein 2 homolog n=1 Tax=Mesocestoides corti TaxID=53468 RepID=A0A5K3FPN7_MESCO